MATPHKYQARGLECSTADLKGVGGYRTVNIIKIGSSNINRAWLYSQAAIGYSSSSV